MGRLVVYEKRTTTVLYLEVDTYGRGNTWGAGITYPHGPLLKSTYILLSIYYAASMQYKRVCRCRSVNWIQKTIDR